GIPLKTGTMSDIFCYAGYFQEGSKMIPFAVLLNQEKNNRERILKALQHSRVNTAATPASDLPITAANP
ncbi:MAG: hypothetical protein ACD_75C02378G0007, partial [uncultured bacterium]